MSQRTDTTTTLTVLIRGCGDIGSAIAHRLFNAGHRVIVHDIALPSTTRRAMAFTDAMFDGTCQLEGVQARRVDDLHRLEHALDQRHVVPVTHLDLANILSTVAIDVVVDARMRKRSHPEPQIDLAPLTIGIRPNFIAGTTTHLAVESQWGDALGTVIETGPTQALDGEPRAIEGHARDRFVYAPASGTFQTFASIGQPVRRDESIAAIDHHELRAPLDGVIRGLTHDGVPVDLGTKVIEIDPRNLHAQLGGIPDRPRRISDGVLQALRNAARPHRTT